MNEKEEGQEASGVFERALGDKCSWSPEGKQAWAAGERHFRPEPVSVNGKMPGQIFFELCNRVEGTDHWNRKSAAVKANYEEHAKSFLSAMLPEMVHSKDALDMAEINLNQAKELAAKNAEIAKLRSFVEAVGVMTTICPTMLINTDKPVEMALEVSKHVDELREENERMRKQADDRFDGSAKLGIVNVMTPRVKSGCTLVLTPIPPDHRFGMVAAMKGEE